MTIKCRYFLLIWYHTFPNISWNNFNYPWCIATEWDYDKTIPNPIFFWKMTFFGKVTPNQKNFMLFADLAWSTKMEYFWASLWPSSSYWIIKWHRCILKLPPYLQDYQWLLSEVMIWMVCVSNLVIYGYTSDGNTWALLGFAKWCHNL